MFCFFEIEGERYMLVTPQLAGISISDLGPAVANVAEQRAAIIAALEFLLTGA
jgi:toxin CcdB